MKLGQRYDDFIRRIPVEVKKDISTIISTLYYGALALAVVAGAAVFAGYLLKAGCENSKTESRSEPSSIEIKVNQE